MTITYVTGNLLDSDEKVIAHGCNCEGVMGAGIAKHIADRYPEVYEAYRFDIARRVFVPGTSQPVNTLDGKRCVFNLATQQAPGRDGNYWFVTLAIGNLVEQCIRNAVYRVGIPRIGCGIAGLDWDAVAWCIDGVLKQRPQGPEFVVYTLPHETHLYDVIDVDSWEAADG